MTTLLLFSPDSAAQQQPTAATVSQPRPVVETYEWGRRMVRELEAFLAFALSKASAVTSGSSSSLSAHPSSEVKPCC